MGQVLQAATRESHEDYFHEVKNIIVSQFVNIKTQCAYNTDCSHIFTIQKSFRFLKVNYCVVIHTITIMFYAQDKIYKYTYYPGVFRNILGTQLGVSKIKNRVPKKRRYKI